MPIIKALRESGRPAVMLLLFAFVMLAAFPGQAYGLWVDKGPETEFVRAIAIAPSSPSIVYAASDGGGIFKSLDAGGRWTAMNTGLHNHDRMGDDHLHGSGGLGVCHLYEKEIKGISKQLLLPDTDQSSLISGHQ